MKMVSSFGGERPLRCSVRHASRWILAALTVATAHAGGFWVATGWQPAPLAPVEQEPIAMIELAVLAVAPELPKQEVAPGPQMAEAPQEKPAEPIDKPDEANIEEIKAPQPEPEIKLPELPPVPFAKALLTRPLKPIMQRKTSAQKEPKKVARPTPPRPRETARTRPPAPRTTAPVSAEAERAERAAAPLAGRASTPSVSPATWRSQLNAHLNRYKRPPFGGATGRAQVAFTIDRAGRVIAARLVASSGDAALDSEAVALMRRASPVPVPPASIGGASITLAVPVRFDRY